MPLINKEKIIGWYDESINHFLCDECFSKELIREDKEKDYQPVVKDYQPVVEDKIRREDMYICDECGERFEEV